jgi:hypothetical protein
MLERFDRPATAALGEAGAGELPDRTPGDGQLTGAFGRAVPIEVGRLGLLAEDVVKIVAMIVGEGEAVTEEDSARVFGK